MISGGNLAASHEATITVIDSQTEDCRLRQVRFEGWDRRSARISQRLAVTRRWPEIDHSIVKHGLIANRDGDGYRGDLAREGT